MLLLSASMESLRHGAHGVAELAVALALVGEGGAEHAAAVLVHLPDARPARRVALAVDCARLVVLGAVAAAAHGVVRVFVVGGAVDGDAAVVVRLADVGRRVDAPIQETVAELKHF